MSEILSAILWFILGAVCALVGALKWCAWMIHKGPKNREAFCNPKDRYETANWIENFFYGNKKD